MGSLLEGIDDHVAVFMSLPAIVLFLIVVGCVWGYFRPSTRPRQSTQSSTRIRSVSNSDYDCPICMEFPSLMIETNCGHRFCAECFILHWKRTIYSRVISCPMCRGRVNL
ncbi:unnamed protein product [Schistosoma margrebowiei]|uniref:RING-type domain-containing protein n=1 Tax=Schistosoma margrebowiei TaxID=48269 RepID=A0AA84ZJM2_9TREM|nr:unnamed protein product [Schistosoma margrebowiei]